MFYLDEINVNLRRNLYLDIPAIEQNKAWENSQNQSNTIARYNSYLNQICLYVFIDWLRAWFSGKSEIIPSIYPSQDILPSIWEVVNGAAIAVGEKRIILIPTETSNLEELSIPQEWVDIPSFVGDFYLAIQVNLGADIEENWANLCGFITHSQIKKAGKYNSKERSYILPVQDLTNSITVMLLSMELDIREKITELPTLTAIEVQQLLDILGDKSIYSPRLRVDIPFEKWGAILDNSEWRQMLYQRRVNNCVEEDIKPFINNLSNWFQNIFDAGWQSLDKVLNTESENLAFAFRQPDLASKGAIKGISVTGVKVIDMGMQLGNQSVALLVGLTVEDKQKVGIRVQLHPANGQIHLPSGVKLGLISQSGNNVQEFVSRTQDNFLQLKRFTCLRGKSFKVRVSIDDFSITEDFLIEPMVTDIDE